MNFDQLITSLRELDTSLKGQVIRTANVALTLRNWLVGAYIVEFEQNGEERAEYGDKLIHEVEKALKIRGLNRITLQACRLLYSAYPRICQTVSLLFERLGLSTDKEKLLRLTAAEVTPSLPADIIKDPYIFEFLGLKPKEVFRENDLEFPFIVDGIADMSGKKFAVIIDEAHSSQSGSAADSATAVLGSTEEEEPEDYQDKILQAMERRKMGNNASYFAFTATPKKATLEKFGTRNADGGFDPFHLYSMKQAIEEDFILDVLAKYTTYKSYYEVQKSIEDNPEFDTVKAQKKLRAYV